MSQVATQATDVADGRRDFDFVLGRWRIANRKLTDLFDQDSGCVEVEATSEARLIVGGMGNCDFFVAPDFPGRGYFEGFTLRLFEPETGLWRIWWTSSIGSGHLDAPVVGRFVDGHGQFECDDVVFGRPVRVRYDWTSIPPNAWRWEQSFSLDGGETWETNWVNEGARVP